MTVPGQASKRRGLPANTAEILRLNTVGGVPHKADYVFVNR
ncbi:hypothetical protein ACFU53_32940 [Streptomyces sp. NPDC057474]